MAILVSGISNDVACISGYVWSDGSLHAVPAFKWASDWGTADESGVVYVEGLSIRPTSTYWVQVEYEDSGVLSAPVAVLPPPWAGKDKKRDPRRETPAGLIGLAGLEDHFPGSTDELAWVDPPGDQTDDDKSSETSGQEDASTDSEEALCAEFVGTYAEILYDAYNQMVTYAVDGPGTGRHEYRYDALGRRIAKTTDAGSADQQTTIFLYTPRAQVAEEQDASATTRATYIYGPYLDEVVQMERDLNGDGTIAPDGSETFYYHTDDMYNVVAITDGTGDVVERYAYADFGQPTILTDDTQPHTDADGRPASSIDNPYLFTGRRWDGETGYHWFRTRYYDPTTGRFTTRDTIGTWGDPTNLGNAYTYVGNNPWTLLDPWGMIRDTDIVNKYLSRQDRNAHSTPVPTSDPRVPRVNDALTYASAFAGSLYGDASDTVATVAGGTAALLTTPGAGEVFSETFQATNVDPLANRLLNKQLMSHPDDIDVGYGSLVGELGKDILGTDPLAEGIFQVDLATGRRLDNVEAGQRLLYGVSAATNTVAIGLSATRACARTTRGSRPGGRTRVLRCRNAGPDGIRGSSG